MADLCDKCRYNAFDEEAQEYYCDLSLDEDEFARLIQSKNKTCKYFIPDTDEYSIVRKQN